VYRQSR